MHLSNSIIAAILAIGARAAKTPSGTDDRPGDGIVILKVCDDTRLEGRCEPLKTPEQICYELSNGWETAINSVEPGNGTKATGNPLTCTPHDMHGCSGEKLVVTERNEDLRKDNWGNRTLSFRCYTEQRGTCGCMRLGKGEPTEED